MATIDDILENSNENLTNVTSQISSITENQNDLIETRTDIINRILNISSATADQYLLDKKTEFEEQQTLGPGQLGYKEFRIVKGSSYDREPEEPTLPSNLPGNPSLDPYPTGNLSNWTIESRTLVSSSPDIFTSWTTFYDYDDAVTNEETVITDANQEYEYGYDYIMQRPVQFDGSYGLNESITSLTRALYLINKNKEQLEETETVLTRVIDRE